MTRRKQKGWIGILVLIIVVLAFVGLFALCTDHDDNSMAPVSRHHSHRCRDEDCQRDGRGGYGNGDRNSKGRDGDSQESGRDSCHSFCGNTVIIPTPWSPTTTTTTR